MRARTGVRIARATAEREARGSCMGGDGIKLRESRLLMVYVLGQSHLQHCPRVRHLLALFELSFVSPLKTFRRRWTVNLYWRSSFKTNNDDTRFSGTELDLARDEQRRDVLLLVAAPVEECRGLVGFRTRTDLVQG